MAGSKNAWDILGSEKGGAKNVQMKRNRKRRTLSTTKKKRKTQRNIRLGFLILGIVLVVMLIIKINNPGFFSNKYYEVDTKAVDASKPDIDVELLTPNPYSRSQEKTDKITGIVIHYTANPGATAIGNRNYFEGLKDSHETKASSNFVVGLNGEIVQCIPTWEVAYASNDRNYDTVSIECCHPDATGKFNDATYRSMVQLTAWLCLKFNLTEEDVIRHYDVTGKICPKYFVENEGAWDQFRKDVKAAMAMNKNPE
ncbi:N-acetylmuramoyl-L-alanine amidase [Dorea formicigenerans]|nr:N-acetylmuramoyl-L-alanine amidase [Dorea formicigenerans]RHC50250.1 N-acetylmuramoyl-L-alanine amidase [Dorea formicigenerans]